MARDGLHLRAATRRDLSSIVALETECFLEDPYTLRQFRHYFRTRNAIFLVLASEGGIAGYVAGVVDHRFKPVTARLDSIAVLRRFRRRGAASRLMSAFEELAKQRGCGAVLLQVSVRNGAAKRLYECFGYRALAELPGYYGSGHDALEMVKALAG